ncbi:response regulator [Massilia yuzhufengensis]|uniref:Two-component system, cell cycle response regulator n=1 Tax=Massilia yuzhufengensis TaxID=1164594 RepID=A0A1I1EYW6_9BURK|nr:response regulator [Massilia yuzhufengensis]SFB92177.1 two-component system, cell cycle response regulator [Massilia yuzhufengensis]
MARILIIEDNPANVELMAFLLTAYGHTPISAPDGARGIAEARAQRPDLVACDVNLPGMNGFAVLATLKAEPALAEVPVLAVTALAMAGDREKVLAAGFDGYISKPIEPESFVAELEAFLPGAGVPPPPAAAAHQARNTAVPVPPTQSAYPAVLLVDDDPFMLAVLADMLGDEPVRVLCANSGFDALALLEREPVEVILCDQAMPGMRGTEVLAQVAARMPTTVRLMLTGQQDMAEIEAALRSGVADAHYPKPVAAASLRERIRQAVALQRSRVAV